MSTPSSRCASLENGDLGHARIDIGCSIRAARSGTDLHRRRDANPKMPGVGTSPARCVRGPFSSPRLSATLRPAALARGAVSTEQQLVPRAWLALSSTSFHQLMMDQLTDFSSSSTHRSSRKFIIGLSCKNPFRIERQLWDQPCYVASVDLVVGWRRARRS